MQGPALLMYHEDMRHADSQAAELPDKVLSVSSLNRMARSLLEGHFPAVLVEGEVSNFTAPASGHWYLTLKDRNAQLRCAMFRGSNRFVKFAPSNGKLVQVRGRLSVYEARGDYQLIVDSMEEAGDGALRRAFEELKSRLDAEGLFAAECKQPVTQFNRHIGIVTSATGAAIRDMVTVFSRRFPAIRLTLIPVAVQGLDAPGEIAEAIGLANRCRDKLGLDALIVGRGGGSLEDLQAFNTEVVARAIHASELPVTSAVGHEIDFTIADFVADLRAPTPSAAAEMMSPDQADYRDALRGLTSQLRQGTASRLRQGKQDLAQLQKQLKRPDRRLIEHAQTLDRLEGQLQQAMRTRLALSGNEGRQLHRRLLANSPLRRIREQSQLLQQRLRFLRQSILAVIAAQRSGLAELSRSLHAVSPLNTLARGYSITYADDKVLRSSADVQAGARLISRLGDGRVHSTVDAVVRGTEGDGEE